MSQPFFHFKKPLLKNIVVVNVRKDGILRKPSRLSLRFSNTNRKVGTVAPSEQLMSRFSGKLHGTLTGLSMVGPHV